jgi:hypothetical protein
MYASLLFLALATARKGERTSADPRERDISDDFTGSCKGARGIFIPNKSPRDVGSSSALNGIRRGDCPSPSTARQEGLYNCGFVTRSFQEVGLNFSR